jgi:hypothetical protein
MEVLVLSKSWYWFLILTAAGLAVGVYSYRTSYPPLTGVWRIFLAAFRGIATLLLGLLLIEPLINTFSDRTVKSRLAVLIDDTSSMSIKDNGLSRIESADSLASGILRTINQPFDLFTFSSGENQTDVFPGVDELSGDATSISRAINTLASTRNFDEYGAMLLVTDGHHNLGSDPVDQASKLDIPVYTFTVGEEVVESNISISNLEFPATAFSGADFKIEVEITARGLESGKSRVFIREGEKPIDSKIYDIPSEGRAVKVEFEIEAPDPGNAEYRVSTPVFEGETNSADNERIIIIRVLKSKINVFLGASSLDWEFKFIRQALNKSEELNVEAVYPEAAGRFSPPGLPRGMEGLNRYDVIIFVDCSPNDLRISQADLKNYMSGGKSIIYVAGSDFKSNINRFGELLPLEAGNISLAENEFFYEPVHKYHQHAALALNEDPEESDRLWNSLPPLSAMIKGIKATGETLLEGKGGFPLWKSYFGSANLNGLSNVIPVFWKNLVRWCSSSEVDEKFKILTDQKVYRLGEPIIFTGYLNDESNSPKNGALITISVSPEGDPLKFRDAALAQVDNGIYRGELESPGAGKYNYRATALSYGDTLGFFSGEFIVESFSLEMASGAPDYKLTKRIAEITGGQAYDIDDVGDFSENLNISPYVETEFSQIRLFGVPYILAFILLLLCVEWGIRKRFRFKLP